MSLLDQKVTPKSTQKWGQKRGQKRWFLTTFGSLFGPLFGHLYSCVAVKSDPKKGPKKGTPNVGRDPKMGHFGYPKKGPKMGHFWAPFLCRFLSGICWKTRSKTHVEKTPFLCIKWLMRFVGRGSQNCKKWPKKGHFWGPFLDHYLFHLNVRIH